jgi:putative ABC transport system permease protein
MCGSLSTHIIDAETEKASKPNRIESWTGKLVATMSLLAQRNLFHDKMRLAVTLTGVTFAVVLIVVELGLYFGFTETTSRVIDHSLADFWVVAPRTPYFELSAPLNEAKFYQVEAAPGVARVTRYVIQGSRWSRPDGGQQAVQIIGFNPDGGMGAPWNLVEGNFRDIKNADAVIVDEFYKKSLGIGKIGDLVEINGSRARVVGFTRGVRSFAPNPYVFTTVDNARVYTRLRDDNITFLLVRAEPGVSLEQVRKNILARVENVEVLTTPEFSHRTKIYWTFTTGAGIAILLAAALGMVVGFVVVAQTIYATTMDHLKEFGTLKAMGAPNSYVYKVILKQAAISALIGYVVGMTVSLVMLHLAEPLGAPVTMNAWIVIGTLIATLLMCSGAALISINKVTRLDPAMVFKG